MKIAIIVFAGALLTGCMTASEWEAHYRRICAEHGSNYWATNLDRPQTEAEINQCVEEEKSGIGMDSSLYLG